MCLHVIGAFLPTSQPHTQHCQPVINFSIIFSSFPVLFFLCLQQKLQYLLRKNHRYYYYYHHHHHHHLNHLKCTVLFSIPFVCSFVYRPATLLFFPVQFYHYSLCIDNLPVSCVYTQQLAGFYPTSAGFSQWLPLDCLSLKSTFMFFAFTSKFKFSLLTMNA